MARAKRALPWDLEGVALVERIAAIPGTRAGRGYARQAPRVARNEQIMTIRDRAFPRWVATWVVAGTVATTGSCSSQAEHFALPKPGPGVIFTYPYDGQRDVPTSTTIVV